MTSAFDETTGYAIIEALAPHPRTPVVGGTRLRDDLMFDSLRLFELSVALERRFGLGPIELAEAVDVTTAGEVLDLVRRQLAGGPVGGFGGAGHE